MSSTPTAVTAESVEPATSIRNCEALIFTTGTAVTSLLVTIVHSNFTNVPICIELVDTNVFNRS